MKKWGAKCESKIDGKMHNYTKLAEEDKEQYRYDQYKKIVTALRLIFPNIPENQQDRVLQLDAPPKSLSNDVIDKKYQLIIEKQNDIINYRDKLTIIFWFYIENGINAEKTQILENLKSLCDSVVQTKKRGGKFLKTSFKEQKEKIDKIYQKIPSEIRNEWQEYYAEYDYNSPPPDSSLSKKKINDYFDQYDLIKSVIHSFELAIQNMDGQINVLCKEIFEIQCKKDFVLFPLTVVEQNFIKFFMNIIEVDKTKGHRELKNGKWELVPLDQRKELLTYIDKLSADYTVINKYIRERSGEALGMKIEALHLMLNNPVLYRIKTNLDDASIILRKFLNESVENQVENINSIEKLSNKIFAEVSKMDKKDDINFLSLLCEREMN